MINLKEETIEILRQNGKSIEDIRWIGKADGTFKIDTQYFFKIADKEYDSGFGSNEVNGDVVVVGDGWWLERWEYDGSEGWHFKSTPILDQNHRLAKTVFVEEYDDKWTPMDNLEYLEYKSERAANSQTSR